MGTPLSIALIVVNFAMQVHSARQAKKRQKKAEREALRRADEAKGFTISAEGATVSLPICYGRNLLGGSRVYHKTFSSYNHAEPATSGVSFVNGLTKTTAGKKHEYLAVQSALCMEGINRIVHVDIDAKDYSDDKFNDSGVDDTDQGDGTGGQGSLRIHAYTEGGTADPMITANDAGRIDSRFTGCAYASAVYRLNRDNYQFNGVPESQFYIEGMKVRTIQGSAGNRFLSQDKVYSNNPALCLIDYIMDEQYGRNLPVDFIDLDSFYEASLICDRVVRPGVDKYGKFWEHTAGQRDIKLYECNISLDSSNPVRENIEILLDTMGQAELVWVNGQYKLQLIYPMLWDNQTVYNKGDQVEYQQELYVSKVDANTNLPTTASTWDVSGVDSYITDEDIVRDESVVLNWPNAQNRYNFVTVKYLSEANNFKEDTVSWPPKAGSIGGASIYKGVWDPATPYSKSDRVTYQEEEYQKTVGFEQISTISPNQSPTWILYDDANIYNTFLREDGGIPMEAEFFANGVTDYYHALAAAEQRCRYSRYNTVFELILNRNHVDIEPGDIIKVTSSVLNLNGELLKVEEIQIKESGDIKVSCSRFTARTLAWNVDDNEIIHVPTLLTGDLEQASNLRYVSTDPTQKYTSGRLSWDQPDDSRVSQYLVRYTLDTEIDLGTAWTDIGFTKNLFMRIPPLSSNQYSMTVVSMAADGRMAPQLKATTGSQWPVLTANVPEIYNVKQVYVYKEADALPANPSGGVFDFVSDSLSSVPEGWLATVPLNPTKTVYISSALATSFGPTTDDNLEWKTPLIHHMEAIGSVASVTVYQASDSGAPATPVGGVFNFDTNSFDTLPAGWSATLPSTDIPIYRSSAAPVQQGSSATTTVTTWDAPVLYIDSGINKVRTITIYRESSGQPGKPTGGVYDFSLERLEPAPSGWSTTRPSQRHEKTWSSSAVVVSESGSTTDSNILWSDVILFEGFGPDGTVRPFHAARSSGSLRSRNRRPSPRRPWLPRLPV